MKLISSWKESLALLKPVNLKPFLMVTAKNVVDLYSIANRPLSPYLNLIILGALIGLIVLTNIIKLLNLFWLQELLLNGLRYFLLFSFALVLRPSVDRKDFAYLETYFKRFIYILGGSLLVGTLYFYIFPTLLVVALPLLFIIYMIFLLFAFDGAGVTWRDYYDALKKSIIMTLYNLPLFCVLLGVLSVMNIVLYSGVAFALGYFGGLPIVTLLYIFAIPIEVALITNIYIKLLHAQPSLYYSQPE